MSEQPRDLPVPESPAPHDAAPDPGTRRLRTTLIVLAAVVLVVIVVALVAVFARSAPAQYDEGTPEGVVQRYSQAVIDCDYDAARAYLVPEVADECERVSPDSNDRRVTLLETTERDDSARVEVLVATVYGSGPFGTSEYENEGVFDLERVGGDWLISTTPWELALCMQTEPR
jgi:hypothetical protein